MSKLQRINGLIVGKKYIARFEHLPGQNTSPGRDYALVTSQGDKFFLSLEDLSGILAESGMPQVGDFVFVTFDANGQPDAVYGASTLDHNA